MSSESTREDRPHEGEVAVAQAAVTETPASEQPGEAEAVAPASAGETPSSEVVSSSGYVDAVADTCLPAAPRNGNVDSAEATSSSPAGPGNTTLVIDTDHAEPSPPQETPARQATPMSEPASTAAAAPRRVRLNPTLDASQARPRPTLAASPAPPVAPASQNDTPPSPPPSDARIAPAARQAADERQQEPAPSAPPARAAEPVEIPRDDELGADLEAEIAAAMSSDSLAPAAVVITQTDTTESAEPADAAESSDAAPPAPQTEEDLGEGTRLQARVQSIHEDDVFLDLGFRSPGVVSKRQFESGKPPEVGQQLQVTVGRYDAAEGLIHVNLPRGRRRVSENWDAVSTGQIVDCMVTGTNKGGLQVTISNLRGFLPASQVDLGFVSNLEQFVGQKLTVQVVEVNPRKRNLVVSRRAYLEVERKEAEANLWKTLAAGQVFRGTVKTVKDYGAFIDIGGVDGFLHVGEISWTRVRHPGDLLQEGQEIEVQVISLDPERKRIGLGMKQLVANPWQDAVERYPTGKTVSGRVTRTTNFGAFIELEPGMEGLVHISELDHKRVNKVTDVLNEGQQVDVQVLEVDPGRKRVALSLKALKEKPAEQKAPVEEDLAPGGDEPAPRRRRGPLKGGYGNSTGSGLFGDPRQYS